MIYVLQPEIFDYFPDTPAVDFALDVFPALLDHDVPFHVHETDAYWNDVGSLPEYLSGNLDALRRAVKVERGELLEPGGEEPRGRRAGPESAACSARRGRRDRPDGAAWTGPLVIGRGSRGRRRDRQGFGAAPGRGGCGRRRIVAGAVWAALVLAYSFGHGREPTVELLWWRGCPSGDRRCAALREEMEALGIDPGALDVREVRHRSPTRATRTSWARRRFVSTAATSSHRGTSRSG